MKLIWLDEGFEVRDKFSISISSMEEVINVSRATEAYLAKHDIDPRRRNFAALCVEEMAGNIVGHGFTKDGKKHTIDIFACAENHHVTIRIKDDCVPFDPGTRNSIFNPADPCKNVGIRLVSRISKEMNYETIFGMNVLTIVL